MLTITQVCIRAEMPLQKMIDKLTEADLALDGDLLSYDKNGAPRPAITDTEKALTALFSKIIF